jgi:poly-gamma-glutamate synthesis protein (capsule biosynthesis protein)
MARHKAIDRETKRDRWLMLIFGVLIIGSFMVAGWQMTVTRDPDPTAYTEISIIPRQPGTVSIAFAGDTMFGDKAAELIVAQGVEATLSGVRGVFREADVAVVNMESPITSQTVTFFPGAQVAYSSPPESADALAAIGVNVLQLGNNHVADLGSVGLIDTIEIAARAGMVTVGGGLNHTEAIRPLLIRTENLTVALISFGENYGAAKTAGDDSPGMVPFTAKAVTQAERIARSVGADRVIALAHWGDNYQYEVNNSQRQWSSELVAAGYDVVIGTGPHILQPIEVIDGVPVAFSIGNFVFGAGGRFALFGKPGLGAVITVSFDADGGTLSLQCLSTNNYIVDYVPRECNADELFLAENELKGGLEWQGSIGTLHF